MPKYKSNIEKDFP